jgi:hypothetical protein
MRVPHVADDDGRLFRTPRFLGFLDLIETGRMLDADPLVDGDRFGSSTLDRNKPNEEAEAQ